MLPLFQIRWIDNDNTTIDQTGPFLQSSAQRYIEMAAPLLEGTGTTLLMEPVNQDLPADSVVCN